jgi:hypothetical protein
MAKFMEIRSREDPKIARLTPASKMKALLFEGLDGLKIAKRICEDYDKGSL